ncbi:nucleic-acid-binding protein from transposon X-element [Trichonephila clavipes]|nr:nucleic-acid-binding protein from transposon X-element [Trichonephila clavipes]
MNPRCLKCGKNHRTGEYFIKEKIDKPICINCNEEGHVASLSCPAFPKIKPKKGEPIPSNSKNKINTLPKTRPVEANISFASVCSGKIKQRMAPQGITASHDQESHRPTTQSEGDSPTQNDPNINFGNFATYIAELGNITSKFPEIFQALEDMSKTDNDIDKLNIFLVGVARSFNKNKK